MGWGFDPTLKGNEESDYKKRPEHQDTRDIGILEQGENTPNG